MSPSPKDPARSSAGPPSPWATLNRLLVGAVGSQAHAGELISSALVASRLPVPPMSKQDVLRFVRMHLFSTLEGAVGQYRAFTFVETFSAHLQEFTDENPDALPASGFGGRAGEAASNAPTVPPPPLESMFRKRQPSISGEQGRPLALIALSDPLERSWLARTLVSEGLDARSSHTHDELSEILRDPARLRVAIVDHERADLSPILRAIEELRPNLPLIVCSDDPEGARIRLRATGLRLLHVHDKMGPRRELVDRIIQHSSEEGR
jgi:hypothetical protein